MTQDTLKDSILKSIERIIEKTKLIETYTERIPQIEIDIVLKEIQELYEHYKLLSRINEIKLHDESHQNNIDAIIEKSEQALDRIIDISKEEIEINPINQEIENKEIDIKKDTKEETHSIDEIEPLQMSNTHEIENETLEIKEESEDKKTIGEKLQSESTNTINDKIAKNKQDDSIASRLQSNSINNLKEAIDVNLKFQFLKDLFKDNTEEYQRAISKLNQMPDLNTAMELLNSLKLRYKWHENPETYELFHNIVKRRYLN